MRPHHFGFVSFGLLTLVLLGGCRTLMDPTFQPAGYAYHRAEYKSPPGPEAADIGYDYTADKNEQVVNEWRAAAADMLDRAQALELPQSAALALVTDLQNTAMAGTLDSALREGLRARGYTLAAKGQTDNVVPVFYSAYGRTSARDLKSRHDRSYNGDQPQVADPQFAPDQQKMELVLGIIQGAALTKKISGLYDLQVFGNPEGVAAYLPGPERPVKQAPASPLSKPRAQDGYNQ